MAAGLSGIAGIPGVIRAQGAIATSRTREVTVAGSPRVRLGDLADRAFADVRARNGQLGGATRALLAAPVQTETFAETDQATTLEIATTFTVVDPDAFRASAPAFASYHAGMRDRSGFTASKLSPQARAGFEAYKVELGRAPANHPLRVAMAGGDDALLDAIAQGKGDVTVRTRMILPKGEVAVTGKRVNMPQVSGTSFDHEHSAPRELRFVPAAVEAAPKVVEEDVTDTSGQNVRVSRFLTGFTKHRAFDWEERWEFGTHDYAAIGAHASYALGLRVPVEITTRMSPTTIHTNAGRDVASTYNVSVGGRALDGDEGFYTSAGLSRTEAYEGKEFVLEADAYASVDVVAGWGTIKLHERVPGSLGIDFGQNFTPPFNDCGTNCGVDIWVPANVTHTDISLLGIVTGKAQIGFNLGGSGRVGVEYTSLYGDEPVDSRQGETRRTQTLSFRTGRDERTVETALAPLPTPSNPVLRGSRKYGYKLASPTYTWGLVATPGVKGTVSVNARPFFSLDEVIGPYWLKPFAMDLGSVTLTAHAGTKSTVKTQPGNKSFGVMSTATISLPTK